MLRQAPFDKIGQTPTPKYTNASPTSGDPGSIPNAETFNQLQFEAENLVALGGLTADGANLFQSAQAAARGGIWADTLTGTGDLAVATLQVAPSGAVLPALLKGMKIGGVTSATNTTTAPKLRVMNVGASAGLYLDCPIIKADGSTPAIGEIKSGRLVEYKADGAGNVVITGGGITTSTTSFDTTSDIYFEIAGSATGTLTPPTGYTTLEAELFGGGGPGGGSVGGGNSGSAGGGGGGRAFKKWTGLTSGSSLAYSVPGQSAGGASGGAQGTAGGTTTLGTVSATGGGAGSYGTNAQGGAGGSGSGGDFNQTGVAGGPSIGTTTAGGAGGGSPFGTAGSGGGSGVAGGFPGGGGGGCGSASASAGSPGGAGMIRGRWKR